MSKKLASVLCILILIISGLAFISIGQCTDSEKQLSSSYEDIVEMIQQVDEDLVFYHLDNLMSYGPRYTGTDNCTRAGQYIYDEFERMGLEVEFHDWSYDGFQSQNVVGTLKGVNSSGDAEFIMCAHYDCTPGSLGADDDGSGVAAVLAAAEVMSNYSFNHTIRFITFSGEEVGTYGSFTYARDAYANGDNIAGVLNVDMIGYADTTEGGRIIRILHEDRSVWMVDFAKTVCEKYSSVIDMTIEDLPNYPGSDHQAFTDFGFDSVFAIHHDSYPYANTPDDIPEHLNRTYEVKATKILLAILAELANKPIDIQVIIRTPYEGYSYFFNRPILRLSFGKQWYKGLRGTTIIFGRAVASVDVISDEEIEFVIFCINNNFIAWDSEAPYEWKIQGKHYPPIGRHKLRVYAYTTTGKVAVDEMDIIIFTMSCQYCIW